ncbi:uncharacterized protein L201_003997 [Kwoniella dendrophila CBS 6074]|uniref:Dipeptidyl-peptidase V n=1 Tax=Kwoniella dendrophila CBS 6074 TaxID=1295534 RepID=A0AAX4JWA1_9TREE
MRYLQLAFTGLIGIAQARKLQDVYTPKDMLSTPRPQPAIASPDGSHAISVVDQWESETDKIHRSVYLLSLNTTHTPPPISLFNTTSAEASQFFWLGPETFGYLNGTSLQSLSIDYTASNTGKHESEPKEILVFPKGVNPTGIQFESKSGNLAFSGQIWKDSGKFEETHKYDEKYENRGNSALVYDELFVRHWDQWRISGKVWTLGLVKLTKKNEIWQAASTKKGQDQFINLLEDTGLYSQMDPISSFSLTSNIIAASIKTPHLNYATHTREDIYLLALPGHPASSSPRHITPHSHGAISALTFSPDGKKLGWLEMKKDGYESDKRVIVVHEEGKGTRRWTEDWDRSPSSLTWSLDSKSLYFTAEHHGRILPYHLSHPDHLPTPLQFNGSTTSITPLTGKTILLSQQSLTSPSDDFILTLSDSNKKHHRTESSSIGSDKDGDKSPHNPLRRLTAWSARYIGDRLEGLDGEEFWFEGAEGKNVMGWAIRPRGWEEGQKKAWPLAFLIHGGPQGAWEDSWSTRWNPAVYASQGYFVVAINPTGSTGYGQEFTDAIQGDWGGKPFKDLLAGYHAALSRYPEIDPERTAALGASYGGYMVNWINGHNDHFGFKALVCHDGVFDTVTTYFSTEEVWFPTQDFAGTPLTHRANYERWSPVNHAIEWTTPELVIQGGKDYRLENSQGLGAFTALQTQGIPSRFVYFPDENHWVLKPHNSLKWHHEVFRWLHEWVGNAHHSPSSQNGNLDTDTPFIIQE